MRTPENLESSLKRLEFSAPDIGKNLPIWASQSLAFRVKAPWASSRPLHGRGPHTSACASHQKTFKFGISQNAKKRSRRGEKKKQQRQRAIVGASSCYFPTPAAQQQRLP